MNHHRHPWIQLGEKKYQRCVFYDMHWTTINISDCMIAAASYGGPLALVPWDPSLESYSTKLEIYTFSGKLVSRIQLDNVPIAIGWHPDNLIVCMIEEGMLEYYTVFGDKTAEIPITKGIRKVPIVDIFMGKTGVVILNEKNTFLLLDFEKDHVVHYESLDSSEEITSWCLDESRLSNNRRIYVVCGKVVTILEEQTGLIKRPLTCTISDISISPDGQLAAVVTDVGQVLMFSIDFQSLHMKLDLNIANMTQSMLWCGNRVIAIAQKTRIYLIDDTGNSSKLDFDSPICVFERSQGLVCISDQRTSLEMYLEPTMEVFDPASSHSSRTLYDISLRFYKRDSSRIAEIAKILDISPTSIPSCIHAALHEYYLRHQKELLQAANLGRQLATSPVSSEFNEAIGLLKVLNNLRTPEIGILISYEDYCKLGFLGLVKKLCSLRHHFLALKVSEVLSISNEQVYEDWALQKIKVLDHTRDEVLYQLLTSKIEKCSTTLWKRFAEVATRLNRPKLAIQLLEKRKLYREQVPIFRSLLDYQNVVSKSIQVGDRDLIIKAVLDAKDFMRLGDYFSMIRSHPMAQMFFVNHMTWIDPQLVREFYWQNDLFEDLASFSLMESKNAMISSAEIVTLLGRSTELFSHRNRNHPLIDLSQSQLELIHCQELFTKQYTDSFMGLSTNGTLFKLLSLGYELPAKMFAETFKIPIKTTWRIKALALLAMSRWSELEEMSLDKHNLLSPELYTTNGRINEARLILNRCDIETQIRWFLDQGLLKEAARLLNQQHNPALLQRITQDVKNQAFLNMFSEVRIS